MPTYHKFFSLCNDRKDGSVHITFQKEFYQKNKLRTVLSSYKNLTPG